MTCSNCIFCCAWEAVCLLHHLFQSLKWSGFAWKAHFNYRLISHTLVACDHCRADVENTGFKIELLKWKLGRFPQNICWLYCEMKHYLENHGIFLVEGTLEDTWSNLILRNSDNSLVNETDKLCVFHIQQWYFRN